MKKETIITAVIFLAVGFLAGYITDAQMNWNARQKAAQTAATPSEMPPPGGAASAPAGGAMPQQGLPEGHPPIDSAAIIQQMEDMAAQNPKDVDVRLKLANFLYDQKQYSKAIEWYQRALELDPKNVNARTDLGTAYFYTGRPQDALREYDKSLAIDPQARTDPAQCHRREPGGHSRSRRRAKSMGPFIQAESQPPRPGGLKRTN